MCSNLDYVYPTRAPLSFSNYYVHPRVFPLLSLLTHTWYATDISQEPYELKDGKLTPRIPQRGFDVGFMVGLLNVIGQPQHVIEPGYLRKPGGQRKVKDLEKHIYEQMKPGMPTRTFSDVQWKEYWKSYVKEKAGTYTTHDYVSLIKRYLLNLPEALIPDCMMQFWIQLVDIMDNCSKAKDGDATAIDCLMRNGVEWEAKSKLYHQYDSIRCNYLPPEMSDQPDKRNLASCHNIPLEKLKQLGKEISDNTICADAAKQLLLLLPAGRRYLLVNLLNFVHLVQDSLKKHHLHKSQKHLNSEGVMTCFAGCIYRATDAERVGGRGDLRSNLVVRNLCRYRPFTTSEALIQRMRNASTNPRPETAKGPEEPPPVTPAVLKTPMMKTLHLKNEDGVAENCEVDYQSVLYEQCQSEKKVKAQQICDLKEKLQAPGSTRKEKKAIKREMKKVEKQIGFCEQTLNRLEIPVNTAPEKEQPANATDTGRKTLGVLNTDASEAINVSKKTQQIAQTASSELKAAPVHDSRIPGMNERDVCIDGNDLHLEDDYETVFQLTYCQSSSSIRSNALQHTVTRAPNGDTYTRRTYRGLETAV